MASPPPYVLHFFAIVFHFFAAGMVQFVGGVWVHLTTGTTSRTSLTYTTQPAWMPLPYQCDLLNLAPLPGYNGQTNQSSLFSQVRRGVSTSIII